ncbi:MAG: isopenicillin N synthase family oxygenase [Deltaproteobacteria bacterium]|nr:isopenicillin N synthase family oxygenase [Deltaproteobacteria bacterium]
MIPTIDIAPLHAGDPDDVVARAIGAACRASGFFTIVGHGIPEALGDDLLRASRAFFALPEPVKSAIAMARGGRAWRGYFPVGGELTSGVPDVKEGLYFGRELPADDARVRAGLPLHGANLFPDEVPELRGLVHAWMAAATDVARLVMAAIARSLALPSGYFATTWMQDPTVLFRIFHYPPAASDDRWGVGEHTDYGVLTLLLQDDAGGLEVQSRGTWLSVPPRRDALVCNIGDMLDRMTGGLYRSTPHRVRNLSGRDRYSFPLFFDPSWDARIAPLPGTPLPTDDALARWDRTNIHAFDGTWGEYLVGKVARVFPDLFRSL